MNAPRKSLTRGTTRPIRSLIPILVCLVLPCLGLRYVDAYGAEERAFITAKLGLSTWRDEDAELVQTLYGLLQDLEKGGATHSAERAHIPNGAGLGQARSLLGGEGLGSAGR